MFDVKDIDANLCTHLIFGFSALNETTNEMVAYDVWNELGANEPGGFHGAYKQFTNLKQKNPALKVLLMIEYSNLYIIDGSYQRYEDKIRQFNRTFPIEIQFRRTRFRLGVPWNPRWRSSRR